MRITIIAVGKLKESYWKQALAEYLRRLSAFAKVDVIEVTDRGSQTGSPEQVQNAEAEDIHKQLQKLCGQQGSGDTHIFTLDGHGKQRSSKDLSAHIDDLKLRGKSRLVFIIGGSHGIASSVLSTADESLSFGPQTWPHLLARVLLLEQIYRAMTILAGHPYHRA